MPKCEKKSIRPAARVTLKNVSGDMTCNVNGCLVNGSSRSSRSSSSTVGKALLQEHCNGN
jgi:hypothetical protein